LDDAATDVEVEAGVDDVAPAEPPLDGPDPSSAALGEDTNQSSEPVA
jgi:hypothetical protein